MTNMINIIVRLTCLALGFSAAGVGCYAAWEAAALAGGGYLMVAAPVVALAAALVPAYAEYAWHARQYIKAIVLFVVFVPCAATVFFTAAERVHGARAGGEAQRAAYHTAVKRAADELADAKRAKADATAKADKVRGIPDAKCKNTCLSLKASETAAAARLSAAEQAVRDTEAKAVTESDIKQPDWLLPLALDITGMVLISVGFGLGRMERKLVVPAAPVEAPAPIEAPAEPKLTARQIAARKGWETRRRNKAIAAGKVVAIAGRAP